MYRVALELRKARRATRRSRASGPTGQSLAADFCNKICQKRISSPNPIIGGCGDEQSTILADEDVPCGKGRDTSSDDGSSVSIADMPQQKKGFLGAFDAKGKCIVDHKKSV
jgi:hypothetical protein